MGKTPNGAASPSESAGSGKDLTASADACAPSERCRSLQGPPKPDGGSRDLKTFPYALRHAIKRSGETCYALHQGLVAGGFTLSYSTLYAWRRGSQSPRSLESFRAICFIERRYGLAAGHLRDKLPHQTRAPFGFQVAVHGNERRRLAWHLPDDFNRRSKAEQADILEWVRTVILRGSTPYRRYQTKAQKFAFGVRFSASALGTKTPYDPLSARQTPQAPRAAGLDRTPASPLLDGEMADLLRFKTAEITRFGFRRVGVWGDETVSQRADHISLLFGALTASPDGKAKGLGVPMEDLSFALLAHPKVWNWYTEWRRARRGFLTLWEADMLTFGASLMRRETGWLRQSPDLAHRLRPIPGLVTAEDAIKARLDWDAFCDDGYATTHAWSKDVKRAARVHRDTFEPILPVLEAESPVGVYSRIPAEILRQMPDSDRHPLAAAEAVRAFLLLRLGLHTGLRQKNLRQLRFCPRGGVRTSMRQLETLRCGEIYWDQGRLGWTVLIPAAAFKNGGSSYFADRPYILRLPDLGELYEQIDGYLERHRAVLLGAALDPKTFFVKTVKRTHLKDASYNQTTFYELWRHAIQRYGIYNPYTRRGAIKGLLPHGPHNVRDVLATHVLKRTGSFEQAGYAIQDSPETVARHYGRFLPHDKAAVAARILDEVWEAA